MTNWYKSPETGQVFWYDDEQLKMGYPFDPLVAMTTEEVDVHLNPPPTEQELLALSIYRENQWRIAEIAIAKDNLDAILFEDQDALPGTTDQWKDYGVQLRKWKEGNPDFPDQTKRPARPE